MAAHESEVDHQKLDEGYMPYVTQIKGPRGTPVGGGFLLGNNFVITCAHVVQSALGEERMPTEKPIPPIGLCFPYVDASDNVGRVCYWCPPRRKEGKGEVDDIAILSLNEPFPVQDASKLTCYRYADTYKHDFVVLGFPEGAEQAAAWARGKIYELLPSKRLQVEGRSAGTSIQKGFSGAAVWDTLLSAVVGTVVLSRTKDKAAYVMPNRTLYDTLRKIPKLLEFFVRPGGPEKCRAHISNLHDGDTVKHEQRVEGLSLEIPRDDKLWPVLYLNRVNRHYPQNGPLVIDETGKWESTFFIGQPKEIGRSFVIELVQANPQAHSEFISYQTEAGWRRSWPGLPELPAGSTVCDRMTVIRE